MLSTAIPTLIAATVIVIISKGILSKPNVPITDDATKILGIYPMTIILKDLKINKSINVITLNTSVKDPIWD